MKNRTFSIIDIKTQQKLGQVLLFSQDKLKLEFSAEYVAQYLPQLEYIGQILLKKQPFLPIKYSQQIYSPISPLFLRAYSQELFLKLQLLLLP